MLAAVCLASVIYAEARGEPLDGQIAVAQVVINRVESPYWSNDLCTVAYQKAQFANLTPDQQTIKLAEEILAGKHDIFVPTATHFYSGTKLPWWTKDLEYIGSIGGHVFMKETR